MAEHRIPEYNCPYCGKRLDGTTSVDDEVKTPPEDGDIGLCIGCSSVMVFEDGKARKPTGDEVVEIAGDPNIVAGMGMIASYHEFLQLIGRKTT